MSPILALDRISKRFGAIVIADAIDLALGEGEALGIIGPNGAGKTTLFGIMTGTVAPDAGQVTFAGRDVTHLAPARRCALGIARSFQIPQPFGGMTVFENLVVAAAFGGGHRERQVYAGCIDILARCGLADKANRLAGALTLLDRKRLELARALATGPKVLLLDEMMNGLTREETASLVGLVRELNAGGLTVVLVEHIIPVIRALCGRLIVVDHGKLIATGTPAECLADPVVVEAYIGAAAKPPARNGDSAGGVASQESKEEA
jgi:branched-chain amino acid transport system ATP-binding protein